MKFSSKYSWLSDMRDYLVGRQLTEERTFHLTRKEVNWILDCIDKALQEDDNGR